MGMLDFSRFGPLGYQDQIAQANASLDQIMRNRAEMAKNAEEEKYHAAELALKGAANKHQTEKDAEEKARYDQKLGIEGSAKVVERLKAGDIPGAQAIGTPYGITFQDTRPLPPLARALAARDNQPAPEPDIPVDTPKIPDKAPDLPVEGLAGLNVDEAAQHLANVGKPKKVINVGNVDITADVPHGESSVARLQPEFRGMSAGEPQAPTDATVEPKMVTFKTPDGKTITVDAEQLRTGERKRMAQDFLDTHLADADALFQSASGKPPEVAARIRAEATQQRGEIKRLAAHIASGAVEPKAAAAQEELGIRQRAGQAITEKDRYLEAGRNSRAAMAAAAASAGRRGDAGPGEPDVKVLNAYNTQLTEAKRNSLATKDLQQLRNVRQSLSETEHPNGPQMQIALDTIVKEAAGGRLSVQLEQNARNAMGGLVSAENFAYRQLHDGENMPKYVNAYRKIIRDARAELDRQLRSDAESFEHRVGAKSHWATRPDMLPYVQDARRAYYEALGIAPPGQEESAPENSVSNEDFINGH